MMRIIASTIDKFFDVYTFMTLKCRKNFCDYCVLRTYFRIHCAKINSRRRGRAANI